MSAPPIRVDQDPRGYPALVVQTIGIDGNPEDSWFPMSPEFAAALAMSLQRAAAFTRGKWFVSPPSEDSDSPQGGGE
mgnify:CR=1 FL=1